MNTHDKCTEAIKEAVEYLDTNIPGWAIRIDLKRFEFVLDSRCIAGQLGLDTHLSSGFDSPLSTDDPDFNWSYAFMDSAWREIVQSRQAR
jgi:hypothetical protein